MGKRSGEEIDEAYMRLACSLARRGRGKTRPNPMVGAVLVKEGRIFGTGYHRRPGSPHAEVLAIEHAEADPAGATLYVNLEPCAHHGRTPPCVDLILEKRIRRVVIGTQDPNPKVNGRSIRRLRRRGVEITCGVLEAECRRLNEIFFKAMETGRPFVTVKAALSLDGRIAARTGRSKWISSEASRRKVHRLRAQADGIVVGIGTVLQDDPLLTVRGVRGTSRPWRVVLDSTLRIPLRAKVLGPDAETLVATTRRAPEAKVEALRKKGVTVEIFAPDRRGRVPLRPLLRRLGDRGMQHLLVEGGEGLYTAFIEAGEVDKFALFFAPLLLGGEGSPTLLRGRGFPSPEKALVLEEVRWRRIDRDLFLEGYPRSVRPAAPRRRGASR